MKTLAESLFDSKAQMTESLFDADLVSSTPTTLYDLFGSHIKKFQHTWGSGLGWTHFFQQKSIVAEWKKEGRPELKGGFSKTTFPPDLQKFIAVILKNTILTKKELIEMSGDGKLDCKVLNDILDDKNILWSKDTMWGNSRARHIVEVQISYKEGTPPGPGHGIQFRDVGVKRFKGLNTENIEICIYTRDSERTGYGTHIWTLLTDLTIKDIKQS